MRSTHLNFGFLISNETMSKQCFVWNEQEISDKSRILLKLTLSPVEILVNRDNEAIASAFRYFQ